MFRIGKIITTEEMAADAVEVAIAPVAEDIPSDLPIWLNGVVNQGICTTSTEILPGQILTIPCTPLPFVVPVLAEVRLADILFFCSADTPAGAVEIPIFDNYTVDPIPVGSEIKYHSLSGDSMLVVARSIPAQSTILSLEQSPGVTLPIGTQFVYEGDIYEPIFYLELPVELEYEFEYDIKSLNYKVGGNSVSDTVNIEFVFGATVVVNTTSENVDINWEFEYQITPDNYGIIWRVTDLFTVTESELFEMGF